MGRVTGLMAGGLWTLDSVMGKIDRRERQVMSLQTFIPDLSTSSRHTLSPFPFFTELTEHMRLSHSRACKMIIIRHSTVIIAHRLPFIVPSAITPRTQSQKDTTPACNSTRQSRCPIVGVGKRVCLLPASCDYNKKSTSSELLRQYGV